MLERKVRLPDRRLADVIVDEVDVGRRCDADRTRLRIRIRIEDQARAGAERPATPEDAGGNTGVGVRIGQPHVGRGALEQAEPAADLRRTVAVEGVIETEAGLDQFLAIDRLTIVEAEPTGLATEATCACDDRACRDGVEGGLLIDHGNVDAHAVGQRQVGVDHPRVLHEHAQISQRPVGSAIGDAETRRALLRLIELRGACRKVGQAAEGVLAVRVLQKRVENVVAVVIGTELQGVVSEVPVGAKVGVEGIGLEHVEMTAALGPRHEVQVAGRDAGGQARRLVELDRDLRQARVVDRLAFVGAVGHLGFGREIVTPVREPLADERLERLFLVIPVRGEREAAGAESGQERLGLLGLVVAQAGALRVGDVPVQLEQHVLHFGL